MLCASDFKVILQLPNFQMPFKDNWKTPLPSTYAFFQGPVVEEAFLLLATKQTCLCAREQVALETPNFPSDQGWLSWLLRSITEQLSSNLPLFLFLPWLLINQQDPLTVGCSTAKKHSCLDELSSESQLDICNLCFMVPMSQYISFPSYLA